MSETNGLLGEIDSFLRDLKNEFPDVFKPDPPKEKKKSSQTEHAQKLKMILEEKLPRFAGKLQVSYNRVFIKNQRTRWGSCSVQGNLNFNWRLALVPPDVVDYVVIHELAHLKEMNHSKRFWGHVSSWCPDYKAHRRWLRDNGAGLGR